MPKILIADDNQDHADMLSMMFNHAGHDTAVVYDGKAAVDMTEAFEPDVVLLDINMPRLDGYDAARAIHRAHPEGCPALIAITAMGTVQDVLRAREAGFDLHMTKPAAFHKLEAAVNRLSGPPDDPLH